MPLNKLRERAIEIILGLILAGMLGWGSWTTQVNMAYGERLIRQETRQEVVDQNITEIKSSQRRMEDKLDRALERRSWPESPRQGRNE